MVSGLEAAFIGALAALSVFALGAAFQSDPRERRRRALIENTQAASPPGVSLRAHLGRQIEAITELLQLQRWLGFAPLREKLARAGQRGPLAETRFLFVRLVCGLAALSLGVGYFFVLEDGALSPSLSVAFIALMVYMGLKLPEISLERAARARIASIKAAWPDALDLMLILVEAGRPVEQALRRVAEDISRTSEPLAEELTITLAELAFLHERRQAYENLGDRTELSEVRSACMAIIQSESQGTSLAPALRALASESRAARIAAAEQHGAKVATFLSLPVMVFFLPPLIIVSVMPMAIAYMGWR